MNLRTAMPDIDRDKHLNLFMSLRCRPYTRGNLHTYCHYFSCLEIVLLNWFYHLPRTLNPCSAAQRNRFMNRHLSLLTSRTSPNELRWTSWSLPWFRAFTKI